jgi:hypothetical protein
MDTGVGAAPSNESTGGPHAATQARVKAATIVQSRFFERESTSITSGLPFDW